MTAISRLTATPRLATSVPILGHPVDVVIRNTGSLKLLWSYIIFIEPAYLSFRGVVLTARDAPALRKGFIAYLVSSLCPTLVARSAASDLGQSATLTAARSATRNLG